MPSMQAIIALIGDRAFAIGVGGVQVNTACMAHHLHRVAHLSSNDFDRAINAIWRTSYSPFTGRRRLIRLTDDAFASLHLSQHAE